MLGFYSGMDLSEFYNILSGNLVDFFGFLLIFLLLIVSGNIAKFLKCSSGFFEKYRKQFSVAVLFLIVLTVLGFGYVEYTIDRLDKETTVTIDEKILIIEIDDYWNIDEARYYFSPYGYTMERYREVSDIIDKYGFTASLGLTPFIFVEEIQEDFDLADDEEMVEYLKELDEKGYELAMHGYNHCRNAVYCPKYEEVWHNVFVGKQTLEKIFGKSFVSYFPPGNYWTDEQYDNVKKAGFKIIGNTHVPRAYFDDDVIITPRSYDPIWHYAWYQKDFRHTPANEWIQAFDETNLFVLQLHVNTFDSQEKLDDLDKFLKYVDDNEFKVMTYREFYDYVKKDEKFSGGLTGKVVVDFGG